MIVMIFICIIVSVVIIIGFIGGVKKTYKISKVSCAHNYLDEKTIRYHQKSDTFIRTYTNRVRINR